MSKIDDVLGVEQQHPSYGCIGISRVTSGGSVPLFMSSIRHHSFVRLRIMHATMARQYSEDRHYAKRSIVEVDMSHTQFAEFITSTSLGGGVPCTLRYIDGEHVPEPPLESKREQFVNEFAKKAEDVGRKFDAAIAELESLVNSPTMTKTERKSLLGRLRMLRQEIADNMPFVASQFNEQMEKTVHEAKGEVEAFVMNVAHQTGLEALRKGQLSIE